MRTASDILSDDAYSLLGIAKIITKLRKNGVEFNAKELRNAYKQLEVNQINRRHTKPEKLYKITGPPGSYQIDLVFLPKYRSSNKGITTFLFLVEIPSRKAFAYPVKSKRGPDILDAYEKSSGRTTVISSTFTVTMNLTRNGSKPTTTFSM